MFGGLLIKFLGENQILFEPLKPYLGLETQLGGVILLRVQSGQTSFRTFLVFLQLSAWRAIVAGKPSFHRYLMPSARRSTLTWNMASMSFYHFINFISLLTTYILWSKTSSVIPFWEHFWCQWRGQGQKFHFQVISNDFLDVKIDSQKVVAMRGPWS